MAQDGEIEALLLRAQRLQQNTPTLRAQLGETLNALGTLSQKQTAYADAEAFYLSSLEVRWMLPPIDERGQSRQQAIAQSLVSLGNLNVERADQQGVETAAGRAARADLLERALARLGEAKEAYVLALHTSHPKVAWALEGMGRVLRRLGRLEEAQEAFEEAVAIRRSLQQRDTSKQLFGKELLASMKSSRELAVQKQVSRGESPIPE